jgi:hypothetical protein
MGHPRGVGLPGYSEGRQPIHLVDHDRRTHTNMTPPPPLSLGTGVEGAVGMIKGMNVKKNNCQQYECSET